MDKISRRELIGNFFRRILLPAAALRVSGLFSGKVFAETGRDKRIDDVHIYEIREAMWYKKLPDQQIQCGLCPWQCVVGAGRRGRCEVRENTDGKYETLVFANACTSAVDPIEKKPFFNFLPGSRAFSLACAGCNVECKFCQNWQISQSKPEDLNAAHLPPEKVVQEAKSRDIPVIAFTYSEPNVFYEYVYETAKVAKKAGIKTVVISNGFINEGPLKELCRYIDGYKVDLKGFTEDFYRKICNGELKPVLKTLEVLKKTKVWSEIVYLVIPSLNDNESDVRKMCVWIKQNMGTGIPLHFSRFHPDYKLLNLPPTSPETLTNLYELAKGEGLDYVYVGNLPGHIGENTFCPACGKKIISRTGYDIKNSVKNGKCPFCGKSIAGVWS